MTYYIKNGARWSVTADAALEIRQGLPVGTYTVKNDPFAGFYLEEIENFKIGHKIYGETTAHAERILNTFDKRENSTGVLLTGEKGSGKTLLGKLISVMGREQGIPTIVINNPWSGEEFNGFIQSIEQKTIIMFDEFEKVYDAESQEQMLTLLDGVYPSRKLFVLTSNDKYRINAHMKNRPGRIFYRMDYTGLSSSFIREYCEDALEDKSKIEDICKVALTFSEFNFDILKAVVEEVNRYGESPYEVIQILNARPEFSDASDYDVALTYRGTLIQKVKTWRGNPLEGRIQFHFDLSEDDDEYHTTMFSLSDLKQINSESGHFTFQNDEGATLVLSKKSVVVHDWSAY